ncbi:MAG: cytochrome c oxidase subunit 3 [Candidatus Sericytochromatia bacterium]|nr:cytochrome c oxidase subunit 3 [Candidatus Sericytochromatia bacterium]
MAVEGTLPGSTPLRSGRPEPVIPHAVFGMVLVIICEALFFSGLMAAFIVGESANPGAWPPPGQPRFPVEVTGANTLVLLASGVCALLANRAHAAGKASFAGFLAASAGLGAVFLGIQGYEWQGLIREGLTLAYSTHASFFYLLVGMHAAHASVALGGLVWAVARARQGTLGKGALAASTLFWGFVVLVWPVLYVLVYLL